MPSALDLRIDAVVGRLTAAGGPMSLGKYQLANGIDVPIIAAAPPTLVAYFAHFCTQHGDADFIVDRDERLSFTQVLAVAKQVAGALVADHGVQRGDRVGIAMRNCPSWIVLYMGILMAGGVAILLNAWWQGNELCDAITDVGCSLVLADATRTSRILTCCAATDCIVTTIDIELQIADALAPLLATGGTAVLPELAGDDLATILFTSGSTGRSKGAISTHRAVVQATFNYLVLAMMTLEIRTQDGLVKPTAPQHALLMTVPMFHVTGEVPMLLVSFAIGRKIVLMPKWDAGHAMALIEAERITNFTGVPLMSWEICNHPDRAHYDLSTVEQFAAGGAPRPPDHVRRMAAELPAPPSLGYGLTETNAVGAWSFFANYLAKPESTGRASAPLVDMAILDDAGLPVQRGKRGEVCIRSIANFSGYWNKPEATANSFTADGYFRTGDIGLFDDDGYLFIVDRKKDIIIRGGENISCHEVEAGLYQHPDVAEACVFGLPDDRFGEVPGAVVHIHGDSAVSEADMSAFLAPRFAAFKIPARIWFSDQPLPRLGTEKIDKVTLRARYQAEYAR